MFRGYVSRMQCQKNINMMLTDCWTQPVQYIKMLVGQNTLQWKTLQ